MTNPLRIALTKRALEKQLRRAGSPRREAEAVATRLSHKDAWRKLPTNVQAEIAWKVMQAKVREERDSE